MKWVEQIMQEHAHTKYIDQDMYPKINEIGLRMIRVLNEPGNSPRGVEPSGTACIGGSDACLLAGLAHKWNSRKARVATG